MFCPNCGKEVSENSKFCIFCGKSTANSTAVSEPQKVTSTKPKRKVLPAILIGIGAFLISFLIIAPIVANSFQSGSDSSTTPQSQYTFPTIVDSNENTYSDTERAVVKNKRYIAEYTGVASSSITFIYSSSPSDEYVKSIIGSINIYDFSVEGFTEIKNSADQLQEIIETNNITNAELTINENDFSYSLVFSFTNLDSTDNETVAKAAAEFVGIPHAGGKIQMSDAESTVTANGYILEAEY